jgi:glutathione peroxidase-family protein
MKFSQTEIKRIRQAQDIAFRMANLHSKKVTLEEIQGALVTLANFAEDILFTIQEKESQDIMKKTIGEN